VAEVSWAAISSGARGARQPPVPIPQLRMLDRDDV